MENSIGEITFPSREFLFRIFSKSDLFNEPEVSGNGIYANYVIDAAYSTHKD